MSENPHRRRMGKDTMNSSARKGRVVVNPIQGRIWTQNTSGAIFLLNN